MEKGIPNWKHSDRGSAFWNYHNWWL